ncbi:hypothetical protein TRICI_006301 [Trichomonascus ciferrii]|uniref:DNA damage-binding protein 1 n=1 Tax=Trichomonascus ciferrii TaxID=44093 RepID=A0A642UJ90_9ASCO|nr:hypothetical protein TRICI_006301 [Trichomonascus ciferrii]
MPSLITPIQSPASILYSAYANITSPKERDVILGKVCSIEIYGVTKEGLSLKYTLPIQGKLSGLTTFKPLRRNSSKKKSYGLLDWLLFITEDGACCVVTYQDNSFVHFQDIGLDFEGRNLVSSGTLITVDHSRSYLAIHAYQGYVKLYKMHNRLTEELKNPASLDSSKMEPLFHSIINHNMEFLHLIDMKFVAGIEPSCLAVVTKETDNSHHFSVLSLQPNPPKLIKKSPPEQLDYECAFIIPLMIENPPGVLAVSHKSITYFNLRDLDQPESKSFPLVSSDEPFTAYTSIDESRLLLGTQSGDLYLLVLHFDSGKLTSLDLHFMGKTVPATSLLHLSSNYFFASSHFAHSILFQVDLQAKQVVPVQEIKNIAPITDVLPLTEDESSNAFILGSGGFDTGCLKKVKRGKGVDVIAEFSTGEYIQKIWHLEENILAVSTFNSTRVFKIEQDDGSVTEVGEYNSNLLQDVSSLDLGYLNSQIYQVTSSAIISLYNGNTFQRYGSTFNFAVFSGDFILACMDSAKIVVFDNSLNMVSQKEMASEVSCITGFGGKYCAVGFWNDSRVLVLQCSDLAEVCSISIGSNVLVRSLKMKIFDTSQKLYIFMGLADGNVLVYSSLSETSEFVKETNVVCGTSPVSIFDLDHSLLVISSRPSLLEIKEGIVKTTSLNTTSIVYGVPLDHSYYGNDLLVFSSKEAIKIASISNYTTVGIQEKFMNEVVFKLESMPLAPNIILASTVRREETRLVGNLKLFDSFSLEVLDEFQLRDNETAQAIISINSETIGFSGFAIGTCIENGLHDDSQAKGRIILLNLDNSTLKLQFQNELLLPGTVYDMTFSGPEFTVPTTQFLAAINDHIKAIEISRSDVEEKFSLKLMELPKEHKCTTYAVALSSYGDRVVMGDLLRGASYGTFETSTGIANVIREASGVLPTSGVELINGDEFLVGDINGTLKKVNIKDSKPKDISMVFNFASGINRLRRINQISWNFKGFELYPDSLIATVSGGLYFHASIPKPLFDKLIAIQHKISGALPALNVQPNDAQTAYER